MEGKGVTAEQSPSPGEKGEQNAQPAPDAQPEESTPRGPDEAPAPSDELAPAGGANPPLAGNEPGMSTQWERPRVRVDARLLEATLLNLRKRIAAIPLVFDIPGSDEITAERAKLLSQVDDYLLPRVRQSAAPLLVALVGSTGAGKSTLVNSIVGTQVSLTGVRRPTTNSPVLACHPDDIHWFAENMFLPTLPRVRQEGLARPGRDGLLVLAASEGMTKGIALLDTPDIDSVVRAHYDFAYQFLDASDLWLFMTSASRYADAPVWELLQHARERGAALGVVLSRVPPSHRAELVSHFNAMLDANGIQAENRFVIPETGIVDGFLPDDIFQPVRDWLNETAQSADRRVAVLSQTMAGMLDTFKTRVPRLAAHVDAQVVLRNRLRREAETAYGTALTEFDEGSRDGRLLAGEVLARWQDYAASGDLGAALRGKRAGGLGRGRGGRGGKGGGKRSRADAGTARYAALEVALRAAIQALVVSVADRAAEQVTRMWRDNPGGTALLAAAEASQLREERAKREFESVFGTAGGEDGPPAARTSGFDRSLPDLPLRVSRAVSAWQDHVMRLLQSELTRSSPGGATPRTPRGTPDEEAKISGPQSSPGGATPRTPRGTPDEEAKISGVQLTGVTSSIAGQVSVVTLVAMLAEPSPAATSAAAAAASWGTSQEDQDKGATAPREVLADAVGESAAADLVARARPDLMQRIELLLDEEMRRFGEVLSEAGAIDGVAAVRLYQAEYSLEAAR